MSRPAQDTEGLFLLLGIIFGGMILIGIPLAFALEALRVALKLPSGPLLIGLGILILGATQFAREIPDYTLVIGIGSWLNWTVILRGKEQRPPAGTIGAGLVLGGLGMAREITLLARGEPLCLACWLPSVGVIVIAHQLDRWRRHSWKSEIEWEKLAHEGG